MTKATTVSFGSFVVKVGDGASPEVFTSPCGLTSKGFNITNNVAETLVPDCTDPDAPTDIERGVISRSSEISGDGVLASESFSVWQTWADDGLPRNCKVYPKGPSGGYWAGQYILTSFNMSAPGVGQKCTGQVQLQSTGPRLWTAGS